MWIEWEWLVVLSILFGAALFSSARLAFALFAAHDTISDLKFINRRHAEKTALVMPDASDGYHSFQELYDHRHQLFAIVLESYRKWAFKTRLTADGRESPGWFIAGLQMPFGQITYHMPEEWWDKLDHIPIIEKNARYDGHSAPDVLRRLERLRLSIPR